VSRLAAQQVELLRALRRHGVEFVVVGGVAAQVHGWRGATVDLDITVSTDDTNVTRLNRALASVGAGQGTVGAFGTSFRTIHGRLEIVRRAHGVGHYADWLRAAREHEVAEGLTVVVAAPEDILRSKEAAGREKDRAALPQMRQDFLDADAL
jgi:hypothetical protein